MGSSGDWSPWTHWLPYLVAVGAILVAVGNVPLMTKGLQEYEALFMVTLFEGCHITVACISGQAVLRELDMLAWPRYSAYCFSVIIILIGLVVIQTSAKGIQTKKLTGEEAPAEGEQEDGDSEINSAVDESVSDSHSGSGGDENAEHCGSAMNVV